MLCVLLSLLGQAFPRDLIAKAFKYSIFQAQCETCQEYGHHKVVHDAADFRQRRAIVDTLGWEPFQNWFYESSFRSWWQLNGLVGVPLYRIYKRKNDWKSK